MTATPAGSNVGGVYASISWNGVNWSRPSRVNGVDSGDWLPSATVSHTGNVWLYTNNALRTVIKRYNMGTSGLVFNGKTIVSTPRQYKNVHVQYTPSAGFYQMLAGYYTTSGGTAIDYLYSYGGDTWFYSATVTSSTGLIGMPAPHPNSFNRVYYAIFDTNGYPQIYYTTWP
jgi:hypothetical protein